jgi:hypothetical protein
MKTILFIAIFILKTYSMKIQSNSLNRQQELSNPTITNAEIVRVPDSATVVPVSGGLRRPNVIETDEVNEVGFNANTPPFSELEHETIQNPHTEEIVLYPNTTPDPGIPISSTVPTLPTTVAVSTTPTVATVPTVPTVPTTATVPSVPTTATVHTVSNDLTPSITITPIEPASTTTVEPVIPNTNQNIIHNENNITDITLQPTVTEEAGLEKDIDAHDDDDVKNYEYVINSIGYSLSTVVNPEDYKKVQIKLKELSNELRVQVMARKHKKMKVENTNGNE